VTAAVDAVNVPVLAPAAMVIEAGTVTATALLLNVTRAPPAGAGRLKVTVPVLDDPPGTVAGLMASDPIQAFTVSTAVFVIPE
jgi:hypothetical protein